MTLELELEGVVLWSLDHDCLVELELEGDAELVIAVESELESEEQTFSMSQDVSYSGDARFVARHELLAD